MVKFCDINPKVVADVVAFLAIQPISKLQRDPIRGIACIVLHTEPIAKSSFCDFSLRLKTTNSLKFLFPRTENQTETDEQIKKRFNYTSIGFQKNNFAKKNDFDSKPNRISTTEQLNRHLLNEHLSASSCGNDRKINRVYSIVSHI